MGQNADDIIEGFVCELCGMFLDGDSPGYPRLCSFCGDNTEDDEPEWNDEEE